MKKLLKWLLILVVGMLGAFITYKIHELSNEWNFTIAFLGGAITMIAAYFIREKQFY